MNIRFDYSGKIVLVTGASQGIGYDIAAQFAQAGAVVHITGTRASASDYDADLSAFAYHQCRMELAEDRAALSNALPQLDILINNAGTTREDEFEMEGFIPVIDVNLTAVGDMCYRFKDRLAAAKGAIVNVGSVASYICVRDHPAYTASKHAILGLTRALADKWAREPIRVNMVAPGFIETRMIDWTHRDEGLTKYLLSQVPVGKFGQPGDIANAVLFLAAEETGYVRGQGIIVDGGYALR